MKSLLREDRKADIKAALIFLPFTSLLFGFAVGLLTDFGLIRGELNLTDYLHVILPCLAVVAIMTYVIYRYIQRVNRL